MASPRATSPSASFYDLSDAEEGEYNTIRHTTSGKGVKLLYTKSKVRLALLRLQHELQGSLTLPGLRAPISIFQRQHPRLRCSRPAEGTIHQERCTPYLLLIGPQRERVIAAPGVDARVRPWRCLRRVRQGRSLRLVFAFHTVSPGATTAIHLIAQRNAWVRFCPTRERDIFPLGAAAEYRLVVWKRRCKHAGWR
jgi:hypothetical protein